MKVKLIIFFLLVVIIGGTVFYFGWIQFRLEEHSCGVIFSKTGGYEDEVVIPGEFNWRWEALIPTNLTLHRIDVSPRRVNMERQGQLPSGGIYGEAVDADTDFSYSLRIMLEFALRPEKLPDLVRERGISDQNIDLLYGSLETELTNRAVRFIESRIESPETGSFLTTDFSDALKEDLQGSTDTVEIREIALLEISIPDIKLYRSSRDYYLGLLDARRETERKTLEKEREWKVSQEAKLEVLGKYGELFTKYPGLVNFLAMSEGEKMDRILPSVDLFGEEENPEEGQLE